MYGLIVAGIIICIITFLISNMNAHLLAGNVIISVILVVLVIVLFLNLAAVGRQPVQKIELSFKVRKGHMSRVQLFGILHIYSKVSFENIFFSYTHTQFNIFLYTCIGTSRSTYSLSQYFYKHIFNVPIRCLYMD